MTEDHYFSADPAAPFHREAFVVEARGHDFELVSGAGVFSRGHLDHATAVLFRELEPPVQGQFLDWGCGYGAIGLAIARAVPLATVTGVDVNERALLSANENAKTMGLGSRFVAGAAGADPERHDLRRDLVEPADPDRQGRAARAVADLVAEAASRRSSRDGRRQEPRRRLAAEVAGRAGLAHDAPGQREGVPGAGDAAGPAGLISPRRSRSAR
ncbi:methyltransferase [Nocardioides sp. B-3]|uniref:methyltransferase n=1 Tax=Nocardioides sp. B-3 TaxID=2895565 RepID=UPI0021527BCF|nr:methyltransferase [Nocardioides sp. B-3]UUZ57881.1 methyltransferase [Nocardioides sp. B-3]